MWPMDAYSNSVGLACNSVHSSDCIKQTIHGAAIQHNSQYLSTLGQPPSRGALRRIYVRNALAYCEAPCGAASSARQHWALRTLEGKTCPDVSQFCAFPNSAFQMRQ